MKISATDRGPAPGEHPGTVVLAGLATSRGLASGKVFLYTGVDEDVAVGEYAVPPEGVLTEIGRFHAARVTARNQLEELADGLRERTAGHGANIFENHLLLFDDPLIVDGVERVIREDRVNCEAAVRRTWADYRAVFARMKDSYLRERVRDLDDLERRILGILTGRNGNPFSSITSPVIVAAGDLTPSETVSLPRELILGFVTDRGSVTSHVALLARALGIPAVTGLGDVTRRVRAGDHLLLDGGAGEVVLSPSAAEVEEFEGRMRRERELAAGLVAERDVAAEGDIGVRLAANVQPGMSMQDLAAYGAGGIGLYRTEYLWLADGVIPNEELQYETYSVASRAVAGLGKGARCTFRVLDLGGDKLVRGVKSREANPFLGSRSLRWLLAHRKVLRTQLRAILRASANGPSAIMFPMVAVVEELQEAKAELAAARDELRAEGVPFDETMPCGCMIEVPSAALNAVRLAREVDFFSIGTNDLVQYTLAADRGNEQVAYLCQPANPAVLRLVDMTLAAARSAGVKVAVCGESASDPVLGVLWTALGADEISMSPGYIPSMRKVLGCLHRTDLDELASLVRARLDDDGGMEMYESCYRFLQRRVPRLEELGAIAVTRK